jgi:hypothetical protein
MVEVYTYGIMHLNAVYGTRLARGPRCRKARMGRARAISNTPSGRGSLPRYTKNFSIYDPTLQHTVITL